VTTDQEYLERAKLVRTFTEQIAKFRTQLDFLEQSLLVFQGLEPIYYRTIKDLELTVRVQNILLYHDIVYVAELMQLSRNQIREMAGIGRDSLVEIDKCLASMGISFGEKVPNWRRPT
jgi:DNA-directed RNA polymerase alpha subunit